MTLFIGGDTDGRNIELPENDQRYVQVPKRMARMLIRHPREIAPIHLEYEEYRIETIAADNDSINVAIVSGLSTLDAIKMLVTEYSLKEPK